MDSWYLGIHSISTLLEQWLPEALNWMLYSTSDINISIPALFSAIRLLSWLQQLDSRSQLYNCLLQPATYNTSVLSFRLLFEHYWNLSIFSPPSFYFLSFNITGDKLNCLHVILVIRLLSLDYVDHYSNSLGDNSLLSVTLSSLIVPKKIFITWFWDFCIEIHFFGIFFFYVYYRWRSIWIIHLFNHSVFL